MLHDGKRWGVTCPSARALAVLGTVLLLTGWFGFRGTGSGADGSRTGKLLSWGEAGTLVLYVFSPTDPEYINNLRFFTEFGMAEGDGCEYVIIVQHDDAIPMPELPPLPSNARYIHHTNDCYDWGTIGWAINEHGISTDGYRYFILMNSSVRGPFVAPYARAQTSWQRLLTDRINGTVKVVGPTISCEGSPPGGRVTEVWRVNPHVQSYVLATDQVGLDIWRRDGNVFKCWHSMWDVIWHGELGSSLAILNAGYSIDSLMLRYQGVNWRDKANWACNGQANPYGEHYLDGVSLNLFEVMFVKVKGRLLDNGWSFAQQAAKYTEIMRQQKARGQAEITANVYKTNPAPFREERLGYMLYRGPDCFDYEYFTKSNADLGPYASNEEIWKAFLRHGAFEGRAYRFNCPFKQP